MQALENLRLELRRGSIVLAVLALLRSEQYGYALRSNLTECGMPVEESTLYPLLRRLETQGLLESQWRDEGGRNKRFYRLSVDGRRTLKGLAQEWEAISSSVQFTLSQAQRRGEKPQHANH